MSRADDTRCRLIEQARHAFAMKGHDGVSIQRDVLQPSGVSNGSFYHQFSDKTELLLAVLGDASEVARAMLNEAITAAPEAGPEQRARRAFEVWFEMVDGAEDLFRIQVRERENPDPRVRALIHGLRQRWNSTIAAALRARPRPESVDADLAARLITSMAYGVLIDYLDTPVDERAALRAALVETLPRFVAGGLAALDASGPTAPQVPRAERLAPSTSDPSSTLQG